jgi:ParB family chromosome partitioning protein
MNEQALRDKVDQDAKAIGDLYRKAKQSIIDSVRWQIACGQHLTAKRDSLLHGEWLSWLKANAEALGFGISTANKLMKGATKFVAGYEFDEATALEISRETWGHDEDGGPVRGTAGTGDNEWFTPPEWVELARRALGRIDVDPASNELSQRVIKAKQWFSKSDDGLDRDWCGKVFLNPPYAQPAIEQFIDKLIAESDAGRTTHAVLLTHNYTDTAWFQKAARWADLLCFTRGRIAFLDSYGAAAAPTQGQAFFYFGNEPKLFRENFGKVGFLVRR